jgi:hypothetical protein
VAQATYNQRGHLWGKTLVFTHILLRSWIALIVDELLYIKTVFCICSTARLKRNWWTELPIGKRKIGAHPIRSPSSISSLKSIVFQVRVCFNQHKPLLCSIVLERSFCSTSISKFHRAVLSILLLLIIIWEQILMQMCIRMSLLKSDENRWIAYFAYLMHVCSL